MSSGWAQAQHAVGDGLDASRGLHAVTTMVPPFDDLIARSICTVRFSDGNNEQVPSLEKLMEEYAEQAKYAKRDALADALIDDKEKPRDHFVQVTANLVPAFRGVTGGRMARLLSSAESRVDVARAWSRSARWCTSPCRR